MNTLELIKSQLQDHTILLYMKGTPEVPQCGFSAKAVQLLQACGAKFATVNILENPELRQALKEYANWPTFPQLYVKQELIGGCDIMSELFASGELQQIIATAQTA